MDKGTTVAEILTARERLRVENIRVGFFIQLGYLGERLEDIMATRRLIEMARPDDIGVSVSYPLPGTKFYERVRAQLGAKTHWQESDDLAMMFKGTYSTDFYRTVRNLLHAEVESERSTSGTERAARPVATPSLQRRWEELIATEQSHRLDPTCSSVASGSPAPVLAAGIA
jgi:anaerobic magnesium-protoporphyrin IX monomethyl ester cyclase